MSVSVAVLLKNEDWSRYLTKFDLTFNSNSSTSGVCFWRNVALNEPDGSQESSKKADGVDIGSHDGEAETDIGLECGDCGIE